MFVIASCYSLNYRVFLHSHPTLIYFIFALTLAALYALACVRSLARTVPTNYILLLVFTLGESYLVSCTTSMYQPSSVLLAAVLTAAMVLALTVYACNTKTDFTVCGGALFVAVTLLFVASIFEIFFPVPLLRLIISVISVLVFSIYLIYDTQLILGKQHLKLTIDDYIFAAMNLYIDIITIFLELLRIFGSARN